MKKFAVFFLWFIMWLFSYSQSRDEYYIFPIMTYDADVKFRTGAMQYYYHKNREDSSLRWFASLETSISSSKTHAFQLLYDSYRAFSFFRLTGEITSTHELMSDFFGFNGLQTNYHEHFAIPSSSDYVSRAFYKFERIIHRITTDVFFPLIGSELTFFSGIQIHYYDVKSLRNRNILHGKIVIPDTLTLFDYYVITGNIGEKEKDGGVIPLLRSGLSYDSRNSIFYPTRGLYAETIISTGFPMEGKVFVRYNLLVKSYISLIKEKLVFALKAAYQEHFLHHPPYYFLSNISSTQITCPFPEGLGGFRSLRGIRRNRILASGIAYGSIEPRWNITKVSIKKHIIEVAFKTFIDVGKIVHDFPLNNKPVENFPSQILEHSPHVISTGYGTGVYFILNKKLILSIDHATTFQKKLGEPSWYVYSGVSF